jgi:predicted nucleic acid-binding protein
VALDGPTFVDTNVLIYAHDSSEGPKHQVARDLVLGLWDTQEGVLSTQVLQEFYNVTTRKLDPAMTKRDARELVIAYSEWTVVQIDTPMIVAAGELDERESLSFWDALIIEAASRAGVIQLLSEDLPAGRQFNGVRVVDPFARTET